MDKEEMRLKTTTTRGNKLQIPVYDLEITLQATTSGLPFPIKRVIIGFKHPVFRTGPHLRTIKLCHKQKHISIVAVWSMPSYISVERI